MKKHIDVLIVTLALLFLSISGIAGIADLSIAVDFGGIENGVTDQQQGTFSITVTNNGPDNAGIESTTGFPIAIFSGFVELSDDGTEMEYNIDSSIPQSCGFGLIAVDPRPGNPPGFTFFFVIPSMPVNTSVTCHGIYRVNFRQGVRSYNWRVSGFVADTDPDFTNNFVPVVFGIQPRMIPALNFYGLIILVLGGLLIGHTKLRLRTS